MHAFQDTIAAMATAPGQGGISILRLSGPEGEGILEKMFRPVKKDAYPLPSHLFTYGYLMDGERKIDECMAVLMRAPRSYTREDVVELHLHGGHVIAQEGLALAFRLGARPAEPGEFTRRAFQNGRIDLSQAEAVMDLIAASGERAAQAAMRQLSGGASQFIHQAIDTLFSLMAGLEAAIDYPEEVEEEEASQGLLEGVIALSQNLDSACDERGARILEFGLEAALCGRPNVGKSSLLNALLGEERAIVTNVPGTTRDILTGAIQLDGLRVNLYDTAGLHQTGDQVEAIGIARARAVIDKADVILLVLDASQPLTNEDQALLTGEYDGQVIVLLNKTDLAPMLSAETVEELRPGVTVLPLSAQIEETLIPLKKALAELAKNTDQLVITQQRHIAAARRAAEALRQAADTVRDGAPLDLCAVDMRDALAALGEITGDQVEERVLDQVFARFCVGK